MNAYVLWYAFFVPEKYFNQNLNLANSLFKVIQGYTRLFKVIQGYTAIFTVKYDRALAVLGFCLQILCFKNGLL